MHHRDFIDTCPAPAPTAAHAATEVGADDKPSPGRLYLWPVVLICIVAAGSFLALVLKR